MEPVDLPNLLRSHGLRVTPQRLAVLATLEGTEHHLSAEEVFEQIRGKMPTVSLATVYNALGELRRVGQVRALPVSGRVRYDLTSRGPHHHLVCEKCQRVVDLDPDRLPNGTVGSTISTNQVPVQVEGFEILTAEVIFRSICPDCRDLGTSEDAPASNNGRESATLRETK